MKRLIICVGLILALGGGTVWSQFGWYRVATVATDIDRDETMLAVEWVRDAVVDRPILIEARDGAYVDIYNIKHIYGTHIILTERIRSDFLAGSRIYQ